MQQITVGRYRIHYEKHISVIFRGKYYSFGKKYIEKFPIAFAEDALKKAPIGAI